MTDGPAYDIWIGDLIPTSGIKITIGRHQQDPGAAVVPMGEVHTDLDIVHNTSEYSALASGVVRYNAKETRLELGPSQSGWQPIVTAVYFDAYDNTGGQTTSTAPFTLNLDTERANSHPEIFVLASDVLQINMSGVYEFEFAYACITTGNTRSGHVGSVQRQAPGGAFTLIDGSQTPQYTRNTTTTGSASRRFILDNVVVGERFRVRIVQNASVGSTTTLADAGSFTVRKLA